MTAIYLLCWGTGCGLPLVALCYVLSTLLKGVIPQDQLVISLTFIAALPASARLAGWILDKFSLSTVKGNTFSLIAIPLVCGYFLETGALPSYLDSICQVCRSSSTVRTIEVFCSVASTVIFCGGVTALTVMLISLSVEIPLRLFFGLGKIRHSFDFEGLRVVSVLIGISVVANLAVSLFIRELSPLSIFSTLGVK